jgi:hypothetical protein
VQRRFARLIGTGERSNVEAPAHPFENKDTEELNAYGSYCDGFNEHSAVLGGFSIANSTAGIGGWGSYSGNYSDQHATLTIKFSGTLFTPFAP